MQRISSSLIVLSQWVLVIPIVTGVAGVAEDLIERVHRARSRNARQLAGLA